MKNLYPNKLECVSDKKKTLPRYLKTKNVNNMRKCADPNQYLISKQEKI